ncbi:unnamed protein product [Dovyalis caffra]|uniref:FAS1 domain-containing protein n=1 Tax=Dovyalis caffra TaxID=77055 RepID=A0AAV1S0H8_9ROSI|nr:unnamed protein product [Dovyalis caffra]
MANPISHMSTIMLLLAALLLSITPTMECLCSDTMATSLSSSGFAVFAHALHVHNLTAIITASNATGITFLAPPDSALINGFLHNESLHGHITTAGVLHFHTLLTFPSNTTLPTLHQNTTLVVDTDGHRVSLNDVLVTVPNLYVDGSCAVHGVDGPLVPIPSLLDDSVNPRTEALPSQVAPKKHRARKMSNYIRFIRRANRPNLSDEGSDTNIHP